MIGIETKDPDETVQYSVDFTDYLGSDTLSSVAWQVPAGLTNVSSSNAGKVASIKLSGGTAGTDYTVTCRLTSGGGLVLDRSFVLQVRAL